MPDPWISSLSRTMLNCTVDLETATYSNSVGAPALSAVWSDPDFELSKPAVYYARILEIETPRWTTYDAVRFNVDLPTDFPATIKERAYTSPICYNR